MFFGSDGTLLKRMNIYPNTTRHLVAVDCIIFGYDILEKEIKLLLAKRLFDPAKGKWSLAGGFVEENESLDDARQQNSQKTDRTRICLP